MLMALTKIACAATECLRVPDINQDRWKDSPCTLCDVTDEVQREAKVYWDQQDAGEMWKDAIAGMIAITQEYHGAWERVSRKWTLSICKSRGMKGGDQRDKETRSSNDSLGWEVSSLEVARKGRCAVPHFTGLQRIVC